ncbi:MAG: dicarboxylate/amino acid:cation symporter [Nitrosopumilus sp.]|nr:dicarboxylate/amino acid:cation symporter [Nitrosopumilus sp.]MDF2426651.1 dicarboxylate/amino acid:cation symporter [Nitrosopumilus sp.]MDF2430307.1 dicarboxylate/amino acid:cation symporter [Nitrosopumilus sp.]
MEIESFKHPHRIWNPPVAVVLLLGVDRILDMTRTMVNVTGDLTACLFFDKRIKAGDLPEEKT